MTVEEYTNKLVLTQGHPDAVRIVKQSLHSAKQGSNVTYYDEQEWHYNPRHNSYEAPKGQNRLSSVKDKRIKSTINFFTRVLQLLNKG